MTVFVGVCFWGDKGPPQKKSDPRNLKHLFFCSAFFVLLRFFFFNIVCVVCFFSHLLDKEIAILPKTNQSGFETQRLGQVEISMSFLGSEGLILAYFEGQTCC